ncbi:MAG: preprotein translocase subunit SecE [Myxococcales bacterium]|nr:MAG: preprotein translocase subunit SecE [Myxococcales bacterium]
MRAKSTWVFVFFLLSSLVVAVALNYAASDMFSWFQINNTAVLGDSFRLSTLVAVGLALLLGVFFGVFSSKSRNYVEQCVAEFNKVAWPEWKETKLATFTVVVVSLVASVILGVFDSFFSWWTNNNLFIW